VTLLFVGSWAQPPDGLVRTLLDAGSAVALTDVPPFELHFDRVASFNRRSSNRPIVLLSDAASPVIGLHARLAAGLRARGVPFDASSPYTPHLTLMYDDARVDPQPVESIGWTVREFALMQSLVGRSAHRVLGRWPLAAA
jgi:2'-5' RNA ligase